MPRGDRTGPLGAGPMTGRRLGYCAGYNMPGYANPINRPNYGWGFRGGRRGWGRGYYAQGTPGWGWGEFQPITKEQELNNLKTYASQIKDQLDTIQKRIDELEKED
ncbi:MAG: DUF5320 domain-containing protein [Anaerolineales bacterium]|nr:DUF5320 domain-containing protein [Anaerolineales bacterium]HEY61702.1 DUF5320 domain-containing protein [Anaerolineae bacterium]